MQCGVFQIEDRATAGETSTRRALLILFPAKTGRAVETAIRAEDDRSIGGRPVSTSGKTVEGGQRPGGVARRQHVGCTSTGVAPKGRPVEISAGIDGQAVV